MKPVKPALHEGAHELTFAVNQPEYLPLPASVDRQGTVMTASVDRQGTVMTEWELSPQDVEQILNSRRVRVWLLHTGIYEGRKLTPIALEVVA
jgi:hypothetical protein